MREGEVHTGADVVAQVDVQRRRDGEKAHSGTHIIHAALHQVLGNEATQRGSFNKEGYLRFDFAWGEYRLSPLSVRWKRSLTSQSAITTR